MKKKTHKQNNNNIERIGRLQNTQQNFYVSPLHMMYNMIRYINIFNLEL